MSAYIREISTGSGKKKRSGSIRTPASEFIDPSRPSPPTPPTKPPKTSGSKVVKPRTTLMPKKFAVDVDNPRIQAIAGELKTLPLDRYPNAISVMFRSLLEMALSSYLHSTGELTVIRAALAKGKPDAKKPADWTPSLAQQLKHVSNSENLPIPSEARRAIKTFISDSNAVLSLEKMQGYTHNRYIAPSAEQLRGFWESLTPLLIVILQDEEVK